MPMADPVFPYVFKQLTEEQIKILPFPFDEILKRQKGGFYGKLHLVFESGKCIRMISEESILPNVDK